MGRFLFVVGMLIVCGACSVFPSTRGVSRIETVELAPSLVLSGPELFRPVSVAVGDGRNVFVLDSGNNRVYEYTPAGVLQAEIGRAGQGPGEFNGLSSRSRLRVAHGKAFVLAPLRQRVQVFDLPEWTFSSSFGVSALPTSVGYDGEDVHLTLLSIAGNLESADVYRFSLDGELRGAYGDKLSPEWNEPTAPQQLRHRNEAFLAVSQTGEVFVVLRWWPSIRRFHLGSLMKETWLNFDWLEKPGYAEMYARPRELAESLTPADLDRSRVLGAPVNFDIAAGGDRVFLLMNGNGFLLVLDEDGNPLTSYELKGGDPATNAWADSAIPFVSGTQVSVSPSGERVCVPMPRHAVVYCYDLPRPGNGVGPRD